MNAQSIILFSHEPSSVGTRFLLLPGQASKGPVSFTSSLDITFIGTAMAIIDFDSVTFLTDPMFTPAGWNGTQKSPCSRTLSHGA
ncbi:uncharacterized protein P174DRAFT_99778 [Aspergillus novofumigatus IBT 16806]|uniref:Uncharacterized protein n=1 Tax=Aspergillus novofumigatus (strain IBT 16806) TaxID=1392255 RepID=A0A2I1CHL4_ASPN1|nr:uncharacterized protein P174DRAFT_99778 [Aspergillus novofumigatus IBT 16806]PKX97106.1 hypothetical protein P174DRAFT_99778 [Aspergillus novofumigatus IBT 16806]